MSLKSVFVEIIWRSIGSANNNETPIEEFGKEAFQNHCIGYIGYLKGGEIGSNVLESEYKKGESSKRDKGIAAKNG